jgi:hypothetical protein
LFRSKIEYTGSIYAIKILWRFPIALIELVEHGLVVRRGGRVTAFAPAKYEELP